MVNSFMTTDPMDSYNKRISRNCRSRWLAILLLITGSLVGSIPVASEDLAKIRVVTDGLKPLVYFNAETEEIQGVAADMVKDILTQSAMPYSMEILPWSRALYIAQHEPNVLIFIIARTEPREDHFIWLHNYLTLNYFLYAKQSRKDELTTTVADYKNARIGVVRNDFTHSELKRRGFNNLVTVEDNIALSQMLLRDRIDFICSSDYAIDHFELGDMLSTTELFQATDLPLQAVPVYFALSKSTSSEVVNKLKQTIEGMDDLQRYQLPALRNQ